jgi:single-strand DNA-binding protein
MNSVNLVGRMTKDVELKYSVSGVAVGTGAIAIDHYKDGKKEAYFFDFTLLGKTAENVGKYMTKGSQVGLSGELQQDRWEKDGQHHSRVKVLVNRVTLLGKGDGKQAELEDGIPF